MILTQKKWPYKKIFDAKLLKLRESGVQDSIKRSWEEDLPNCKVLSDDDSQALGPGSTNGGMDLMPIFIYALT